MLLEIPYITFLLLNSIHASATFSPSSNSIHQKHELKKTNTNDSWRFNQEHHHLLEKSSAFSSNSFSKLYNLRGGGGEGEGEGEGKTELEEDSEFFIDDMLPPSLRKMVQETKSSQRKIIVVTGGVLSGIGKGVTASSIGVLLRAMGLRVTALKIDPYLNVDAGTMSPFEHGEVFVLDDGGETDLDLGNYERFLSVSLTKESNLSTGKIYQVRLLFQKWLAAL
jgi:hypothetical protein